MAINYIEFVRPVSLGGAPLNYVSRDKHGGILDRCVERGSWLIVEGEKAKRYRIPLTNIVVITEDAEPQPGKGAKGG